MYVLSFTPNECGIAVDADLRFFYRYILEQLSAGNKAIKKQCRPFRTLFRKKKQILI